jgi:type II secretory pathway component PulK
MATGANGGPGGANNGNQGMFANGQGGNRTGAAAGGASQVFSSIGTLLEVPGFTRPVMQQIADRITVSDAPYRDWVVNINTAPSEVLATVPGMQRSVLDAIVQYRQGGQAFQTLGDLFSIQSITRTQYESVLARLATKSSTYIVNIKVRTPGQQDVYAVSALVELDPTGPVVLQWREVPRSPGWATWIHPMALPTPTPPAASGNVTSSGGQVQ